MTGGRCRVFLILRILSCGNYAGKKNAAYLRQLNQAVWDMILNNSITDLKTIVRDLGETPCRTFWHILCHPGTMGECCVGPTRKSNVVSKPSPPRLCHTTAFDTRLLVDDKCVTGPARNSIVDYIVSYCVHLVSLYFHMFSY